MRGGYANQQGLRELTRMLARDSVGVEVGCYKGESAQIFMDSGQVRKLVCVDFWPHGEWAAAEKDFDENVARFGKAVEKIKGKSVEVAEQFNTQTFDFCLPAESPIWMNDFTFKPISAVKPGDVVIGWRKQMALPGRGAKGVFQRNWLCSSIVSGVTELTPTPIVKLTLGSGRTIRCTPDHLWLNNYDCSSSKTWRKAAVGNKLCCAVDVPTQLPVDLLRTAAWLGGVYDGEGCRTFIAQNQKHNPLVYAEIGRALAALGFRFRGIPLGYYILGGRSENTRFVNWCQPVRYDHRPTTNPWIRGACHFEHDQIVSIEPDGCESVHTLTTSTGNYVAWGFASKNCYIDANHNYEEVKADIAAWRLKVKAGGLICGHDFHPTNFPGVIKAVGEAFHSQTASFQDHSWAVRLPSNNFEIVTYVTGEYAACLKITLPTWLENSKAERIVIYTDVGDLTKLTDDKRVEVRPYFKTRANGMTDCWKRKIEILINAYHRCPSRFFCWLDADVYVASPFKDAFYRMGTHHIGATRMFNKTARGRGEANAGVIFFRHSPELRQFFLDWHKLSDELEASGHAGVWFEQCSMSRLVHEAFHGLHRYSAVPLSDNLYNLEDDDLKVWFARIKKHNPKLIHMKQSKWKSPAMVDAVRNEAERIRIEYAAEC